MKLRTLLIATLLCVTTLSISIAAPESAVTLIPLAAPLDRPDAEISGLAWCGDTLIVMPQYPDRLSGDEESHFFGIDKADIYAYLNGESSTPLRATPITLIEGDLRKRVPIFDGYEALACDDNQLWLSIEAVNLLSVYQGYVVKANISLNDPTPHITIDSKQLWNIDSASRMHNMGEEAMLLAHGKVITFHEINDPRLVKSARASVIDPSTAQQSHIDFPHLPFRVTDSTALDQNNRFWLMNYKYSGDKFSRSARDPLVEQYGEGATHAEFYNVERLVEFELTAHGITRLQQPPIQLQMLGKEGRNWEGLVRLDDIGFLVATDKHPATLFGFIALPSPSQVKTKPSSD
ncbi:hypothetical protein [Arenicella xantha]|nr:hypothetical protein [Arenicella xantha]